MTFRLLLFGLLAALGVGAALMAAIAIRSMQAVPIG
jgi:hypothetical protein